MLDILSSAVFMDNNDNKIEIKLDGKTVTQQELQEAQNNPNVRIIETTAYNYKTLERMQG